MAPLQKNTIHPVNVNWLESRKEFEEFKKWFFQRDSRDEASIQKRLHRRKHLIQLIGHYFGIKAPDQVAIELDILGRYKPDLVIIDSKRKSYCMIELEPAQKDSIFSGTNKKRIWSRRYECGFSQCVDWAGEFAVNAKNEQSILRMTDIKSRTFALVIGKKSHFKPNTHEVNRYDQRRGLINRFNFFERSAFQTIDYEELLEELELELQDLKV